MAGRQNPALKLYRTPQEKRDVYIYEFADGQKVTITPGEDGVTEIDVQTLHKLDDHEVYFNIKASRPQMTAEEKAQMRQWRQEHPGERPAKNWTVSLDALAQAGTDDDDAALGRAKWAMYHASLPGDDCGSARDRLLELVAGMPPKRQAVYQLAMIDGLPNTQVASMLGVTEGTIRYDIQAIRSIFQNDPVLRSYMRERGDPVK